MNPIRRFIIGALLAAVAATTAHSAALIPGMPLAEALEQYREDGLIIVYSSDLIRPDMRISSLPAVGTRRDELNELLKPFALQVRQGPGETLLVVRAQAADGPPGNVPVMVPPPPILVATPLDEIIVSTSRYQFSRDSVVSSADFTAADLEILPNVGDDPLRALERLPGTATNDFSARTNVRGGYVDENLVRLDGFRLYNPFHFKDFQGLFSVIDPRLVGGMDVYTGGFNVGRGDVMSSVIDVSTVQPEQDSYGEISASFFNLSGLYAQRFNQGKSDWLLSARRGNLDWVLDATDPKLGKPKYFDIYTRLSHELSDRLAVTGSVLLIDDNIDIVDTDEEEFAQDNYRDSYYWLRIEFQPDSNLQGNLLLSRADLEGRRGGTVDKDGATTGVLMADNDFRIDSIETNWSLSIQDNWLVQFGGEFRDQRGSYAYVDEAEPALLFQTPGALTADIFANDRAVRLSGEYYSLYSNVRTQWTDRLTSEFGIRWSRETLSPSGDSAVDPRFGIKYEITPDTRVRLNLGRFSQSQSIDQLDFADGEMVFRPMQRVDQVVASLDHDFAAAMSGRVELYYKKYRDLRPRYENFLDTFTLLPQLWPDRIELLADEARAKGLELTLRSRDAGALGWWFVYSWSRAEDAGPTQTVLRSWDQRNAFGAGLDWANDIWEYSVAARVQEGRPTTLTQLDSLGPPAQIATGTRNAERLGTYFSLDARVARHWQLADNRLTVFFEVRNLTNRKNDCCVLYELNDESGPLTYETDTEFQVPIFPSLGFIWQF